MVEIDAGSDKAIQLVTGGQQDLDHACRLARLLPRVDLQTGGSSRPQHSERATCGSNDVIPPLTS